MGLASLTRILIHFAWTTALSLGIFSPISGAQGRTQDCLASFAALIAGRENTYVSHPPIQIRTQKGVVLSKKEEKALRAQFDKLANLTQGKLKLPEDLIIEISHPGDEAGYLNGVIVIPKEFVSAGYSKDPKTTRTVVSHEWGHALLEVNIKERAPELILFLKEDSLRGMKMSTILSPYGEFFADVIASMEAKDGRAVRNVLFSAASGKRGSASASYRDFTARHRIEGWEFEGQYTLLSPARNAVWEVLLSRPKAQRESGRTIEALVDSIVNEASRQWIPLTPSLSPEQINRGLLDEILRRLNY